MKKSLWKKLLFAGILVFAAVCTAEAAKPAGGKSFWLEDYGQARKTAAEKKLPILMVFSGSDWCPPCIKLNETVFSKKEFTKFAKSGKAVLFYADFPRKNPKPQKIARQNQHLMRVYKVRGVPTVVLTDASGKEFARTGYRPGGVKKYIRHLNTLLKKAPK